MTLADVIAATKISGVWIALGGDPPKHGRAPAFYRNGDNPYAVSLNDGKHCWHDFVTGEGGGVLHLIQLVLGCDRASALRWLSDFTGLPLDAQPFTLADRWNYRRHRAQADRLARDVADWERGLELVLLRSLDTAAEITLWLLSHDTDPGELLAQVRRDLATLRHADADSLVLSYSDLPDPVRRRFVEAGKRDREDAVRVTRALVELLAQAEECGRPCA